MATRSERAKAVKLGYRLLAHDHLEVPSSSNPLVVYKAVVQVDGKTLCDCRGWTIKKVGKPRECKHTRALIGGRPTRVIGDFLYVVIKEA